MRPQLSEVQAPPDATHSADAAVVESSLVTRKRSGFAARLLHGTGAGAVSYGLSIVSNLLLLPLYLRYWSVAVYGEWMALYSIVTYLANLDFGLYFAAVNAATIAHARNDWETFERVQGTAWAASLLIAGVGSSIVIALSIFYFHVNQWLGLRVMSLHDARSVFCCLAISFLAGIPGRQLIAVYIAIGEFPKYQWLYNAFAFLSCVVAAAALSAGAGPGLLAALIAASSLFTIVLMLVVLRRRDVHLVPRIRNADWHTARTLAAPTGQVGIAMFATALALQGPVVVLSRVLGGPAVALFTTTRTVANVVRSTVIMLRAPLRPELAAASAHPTKDSLRRLFRIAVSIDTVIAISLAAALWSAGGWLIGFWSHHRIPPDERLMHLLLIVVVLEGFLQVLASTGWATNRIQGVSIGQLTSTVAALAIAIVLVGKFGPSAVPLGAIIPLIVIMAPMALRNACKETDLSFGFVAGRMLLPFAGIVVFAAGFPAWLSYLNVSPHWLFDLLSALAVFLFATIAVGTVFLTSEDRSAIRAKVLGG